MVRCFEFKVKGFVFPIEMLHHEQCWPASVEDCDLISIGKAPATVTLQRWSERQDGGVNRERWALYNWEVTEVRQL